MWGIQMFWKNIAFLVTTVVMDALEVWVNTANSIRVSEFEWTMLSSKNQIPPGK